MRPPPQADKARECGDVSTQLLRGAHHLAATRRSVASDHRLESSKVDDNIYAGIQYARYIGERLFCREFKTVDHATVGGNPMGCSLAGKNPAGDHPVGIYRVGHWPVEVNIVVRTRHRKSWCVCLGYRIAHVASILKGPGPVHASILTNRHILGSTPFSPCQAPLWTQMNCDDAYQFMGFFSSCKL